MSTINFKRGGTFSFGCKVKMPAGTWSAVGKLREPGGAPVQTLTVTLDPLEDDPDFNYTILIVAPSTDTPEWPVRVLRGDIKFSDASTPPVVLPTSTFTVAVEEMESR